MCECYQIGGRFIAEDPDCPIHGTNKDQVFDEVEALREQVESLKADKLRMDFLQDSQQIVWRSEEEVLVPTTDSSGRRERRMRFLGWCVGTDGEPLPSVRAAIDAAMEAKAAPSVQAKRRP